MPFYFIPYLIQNPNNGHLSSEEVQRAIDEFYGGQPSGSGLEYKVTAAELTSKGTTFRQRAFGRTFGGLLYNDGDLHIRLRRGEQWEDFPIKPRNLTTRWLMGAVSSNKEARNYLTKINIVGKLHSSTADPEVTIVLQDLADAVAQEATNAFQSKYYPGIPDITVPEKLVDQIMVAMQRELDREGLRLKNMAQLSTLSRDRQRALAERRRWWFSKFGITPESWRRGTFNLWKISNEPIAPYAEWIKFNSWIVS
jgi:hypothetical protein